MIDVRGVERIGLLFIYAAATVVAIVLVNAGDSNLLAIVVWWSASVLLGWRWRMPWLGSIALLAVPISVPFGYAEDYHGGVAGWVPFFAIVGGLMSGSLIALAALGASILAGRRRDGSAV